MNLAILIVNNKNKNCVLLVQKNLVALYIVIRIRIFVEMANTHEQNTLRLVLLAGTNFSVLVVCCIWQVFILAFLR